MADQPWNVTDEGHKRLDLDSPQVFFGRPTSVCLVLTDNLLGVQHFGVLLEEVNEPLRVSMYERMGWFPVVLTGIKALHSPFSSPCASRMFFSSYFPPSMTRCNTNFEVQNRGSTLPLGEEISPLLAIAGNFDVPVDIHRDLPPILS